MISLLMLLPPAARGDFRHCHISAHAAAAMPFDTPFDATTRHCAASLSAMYSHFLRGSVQVQKDYASACRYAALMPPHILIFFRLPPCCFLSPHYAVRSLLIVISSSPLHCYAEYVVVTPCLR